MKQVNIFEYFCKNCKPEVDILIEEFHKQPYYCPKCKTEIASGTSVSCDSCYNWFHQKCVNDINTKTWFCENCKF